MNIDSRFLVAGLSLMAMFCVWYWLRRRGPTGEKQRIPGHWTLHARGLMNREELQVWRWLTETFDDHHVMIKLPMTRFTRPNTSENVNLQKTLVQQRDMRKNIVSQDDVDSASSSMPTDWPDSFLIQSNSRPAELR